MCTHSRFVYNKYIKRNVLVSCGHCEACLQEKACACSNRIRNNVRSGTIALFVTLTYTNDFVPYVSRQSLYENSEILVLRRSSGRFVYNRHENRISFRKSPGIQIIRQVGLDVPELNSIVPTYQSLNGLSNDCIGVLYYPDLQNFFKRLRVILSRHYNYENEFSYFACSELGAQTKRPHFHTLIFIRKDDETVFRRAILEAWPFADSRRTSEYIEVARDAASYVSSYVNCHTDLFPLFQNDAFKPKHSYSKHFGVMLDVFSLSSILSKIDTGDLYYYSRTKFDGETDVLPVPIPKYVLNRYFPQFKGFSRLPLLQLRQLLLEPASAGFLLRDATVDFKYRTAGKVYDLTFNSSPDLLSPLYHYSCKETYRIYVSLENAYQYFHRETGLNRYDYMLYYIRCWNLHFSISFYQPFKDITVLDDYADFYSNTFVLEPLSPCHLRRRWLLNKFAPTLSGVKGLLPDPNERESVKHLTAVFTELFYKLDKEKKVLNFSMSHMGHNV